MRTVWIWASVVVLSVAPTLAQAESFRKGGGHSGSSGHSNRGGSGWGSSSRSDRGGRGWSSWNRSSESSRQRSNWTAHRRGETSWRSERSERRSGPSYSDRGRSFHNNRSYSRPHRSFRESRPYSYRSRPRSGWAYRSYRSYRSHRPYYFFRYRSRYPSHYRYGYYHIHGYYYPRYYFEYASYPDHGSIRVMVEPAEAEVYIDGYYAGIADDFDGVFQRLRVAPGRHEITLRLDGFQTWSAEIVVAPGSTLKLHHDMLPGASEDVVQDYSDESGEQEIAQ